MSIWSALIILFTLTLLTILITIVVCGMVWDWSEKRKALRQRQLEDSAEDSGSTGDDPASVVLERSKRFIESIPDEDKALPKGICIGLADLKESLAGIGLYVAYNKSEWRILDKWLNDYGQLFQDTLKKYRDTRMLSKGMNRRVEDLDNEFDGFLAELEFETRDICAGIKGRYLDTMNGYLNELNEIAGIEGAVVAEEVSK